MDTEGQSLTVNEQAKKERHQKLFDNAPVWERYYYRVFKKPLRRPENGNNSDNPGSNQELSFEKLRKTTFWKLTACSLAFFLVQGAVPTYAYFDQFEEDYYALLTNQDIQEEPSLITANDDGFIFKVAGQSELGNRKNMADIIEHEVQPGENLSIIAHKYQIKQSTITQNNSIINTHRLKTGQTLLIPPVDGVIHTVKSKETLQKIAKKYKIKNTSEIVAQNKLEEGAVLQVNQLLIIPGAKIEIPRDYIAYNRGVADNALGGSYKSVNMPGSNTIKRGGFIKPTNGIYTKRFGRGHYAVDIANRGKGPIYAAADGVVQKSSFGWNGGYGNVIVLSHPAMNATTLYAHNSELYVKVGDKVTQGQVIGWMGNTGRVYGRTGIHLHFEIAINGVKRNPLSFF